MNGIEAGNLISAKFSFGLAQYRVWKTDNGWAWKITRMPCMGLELVGHSHVRFKHDGPLYHIVGSVPGAILSDVRREAESCCVELIRNKPRKQDT